MDDRRLLCFPARADAGKDGRDACADVLAEQHIDRAVKTDQPAGSQRLQDADRSAGRLDDRGEYRACQDADQRIGERSHQLDERRFLTQRQHRCAHHVHADEQHAQSRQDRADVLDLHALDEYDQRHADKRDERRDGTDIKRDELTGDGGADVGAHDDPYRLGQRHHARVDEAHDHDRRGAG